MAGVRFHCTLVLLLYLKISSGQQAGSNNQNIGGNNAGSQQQTIQWTTNNMNQIPNAGLNINVVQQPNKQQQSLQQCASKQGNSQQSLNFQPNVQSQTIPISQNGFQITKIGFTPVSSGNNNPYVSMQTQNGCAKTMQQNIPMPNTPVTQVSNAPITISTLAELLALKGQPSLLSLLNPQNGQYQQNQQTVIQNSQNQLTDVQKQFLVRALQGNQQTIGQNQQGINLLQNQPLANMGTQQAIVTPMSVTPNQQSYITVQAQPLNSYLQYQSPQVTTEEEPSIISLILSELDPQYATNPAYQTKKGSKPNLKSLIPLIINLLKEKNNCNCANCGCPNNGCQNPEYPIMMTEPIAQIFGGYSNQKKYGPESEDSMKPTSKKKEETKNKESDKGKKNKKVVVVESEEYSDENDSEYLDDGEE